MGSTDNVIELYPAGACIGCISAKRKATGESTALVVVAMFLSGGMSGDQIYADLCPKHKIKVDYIIETIKQDM